MRFVLVWLIGGYRIVLSPFLHTLLGPGYGCRFRPSCSEYAQQAILRFGVWRGSWLALRRLARCHPWGGSGVDPVPESWCSQQKGNAEQR